MTPAEHREGERYPHFENCGMAEATMPCACLRRRASRERVLVEALERIAAGESEVGSTYSWQALRNLANTALNSVQEGER